MAFIKYHYSQSFGRLQENQSKLILLTQNLYRIIIFQHKYILQENNNIFIENALI